MSVNVNDYLNQGMAAQREQSAGEDAVQSAQNYQRNRQLLAMKEDQQFDSHVRNFNLEVNSSMLGSMEKVNLAR